MKSFKHFLNESIVDQFLAVKEQALKAKAVVDQHNAKPSIVSRLTNLKPSITVKMPGQGVNANMKSPNPRMSYVASAAMAPIPKIAGAYNEIFKMSSSKINRSGPADNDTINTIAHELAHSYQHETQNKNTKQRISNRAKKTIGTLAAAAVSAAHIGGIHTHDITSAAMSAATIGAWGLIGSLAAPFTGLVKTSKPRSKKMSGNIVQRIGKRIGLMKLNRRDRNKKKFNETRHPYWNSDVEANARVIGHAVEHLHDYHHQMARHLALDWNHEPGKMISDFRNKHMKAFEDSEKDRPVSKSVRAHMKKQFGRILQHHENQLPKDLHTDSVAVEYFNKHHGDFAAIGKERQARHDAIYKQ